MVRNSGFSLLETMLVAGLGLVSLLLVFRMLGHASACWRIQEARCETNASARTVIARLNDLLAMAGYRSSEQAIHLMEPERLAVEYLVEDAEALPGKSTRHRLFTMRRDGSQAKLTIQRRLVAEDGTPSWGEGSTTVLSEGVRELSFTYLDGTGAETADPSLVRLVGWCLRLEEPSSAGDRTEEVSYRSSVCLRNVAR